MLKRLFPISAALFIAGTSWAQGPQKPTPTKPALVCSQDASIELAFPCRRGEVRSTFLELADGSVEPIQYEWIDGQAVFEGDIILHLDDDGRARIAKDFDVLFSEQSEDLSTKSAMRAFSLFRWASNTVHFRISSDLPNPQRVLDAMDHWELNTNVNFHYRTSQTNWVEFIPGDGCSSSVGKQGGRQQIVLADGCSTGTVVHEIGHTVGLWHEQARADRYDHVIIHWDVIEDGKEHNFKTYRQRRRDGVDHGSYDFGSIMHYSPFAFSDNGLPTITRNDGSLFSTQRNGLSPGDIAGVASMYWAPAPPPPPTCDAMQCFLECGGPGSCVGNDCVCV